VPVLNALRAMGWQWEPTALAGLLALSGAYALAVGPLRRRRGWGPMPSLTRQIAFHVGTLGVLLALNSPLDPVADRYLFSAHMVQHIILTYIAPPLWLLGLPVWLVNRLAAGRSAQRILAALTQPVTAFLIFNGVMWAWHIPSAYDAALENQGLHIVEHLMFMAAAVIGWWPIVGKLPPTQQALSLPGRVAYLFGSVLSCTALAALITFSPGRLYPFYGDAPLLWGLTPMLDQQIGGLAMWLPTDIIFVTCLAFVFNRWLSAPPDRSEVGLHHTRLS
jgi:putative membrane protein